MWYSRTVDIEMVWFVDVRENGVTSETFSKVFVDVPKYMVEGYAKDVLRMLSDDHRIATTSSNMFWSYDGRCSAWLRRHTARRRNDELVKRYDKRKQKV